jgi:hypothetical protein
MSPAPLTTRWIFAHYFIRKSSLDQHFAKHRIAKALTTHRSPLNYRFAKYTLFVHRRPIGHAWREPHATFELAICMHRVTVAGAVAGRISAVRPMTACGLRN